MNSRLAFCTIATPGYLPMAGVLIDSIKAFYGDACDIHLLVVSWERVDVRLDGVNVVHLHDLADAYYWDMALRYDIGERAAAYKPIFLRHVNSDRRYDRVFYLDVDMELFARLDEAEELLRGSGGSILLSPHSLTPRYLDRPIGDRSIFLAGTFNSGLLAVDSSEEAFQFIDWWATLNRTECVIDGIYFSRDQKWLSLVPSYFEHARILRHPGYNVAHFNLDERGDVLTSGALRLFHFTNVHQHGWDVAKYIAAFALKPNKAMVALLNRYVADVRAKRKQLAPTCGVLLADDMESARDVRASVRRAYRAKYPAARIVCESDFAQVIQDLV